MMDWIALAAVTVTLGFIVWLLSRERDKLDKVLTEKTKELANLFTEKTENLSKKIGELQDEFIQKIETQRQQIFALQQTVETEPEALPLAPQEEIAGLENLEKVRSKWADMRERIEFSIQNLHGNARRKFGIMTRYNYAEIIDSLARDKPLSNRVKDALLMMNETFLRLRRKPQNTTRDTAEHFAALYGVATQELPQAVAT